MSLLQRADKWTQQWKEEGLAEGRAEGGRLVAAKILKSQLRQRFGDLSGSVIERIDRADVEMLERWAQKILDGSSIEGILQEE